MYSPKPLLTRFLMGALTVALASGAVCGNGFILALIARFPSLRTAPNTLVANIAVVDLLNAVINMPIYMIYLVFEASWYRGQTLAILTCFLNRLFILLNLVSMLALMVHMYFAITFDLKYLTWKTNKKAVGCACLIWFICTVIVILYSIPLLGVDLGDAHVIDYRAKIYKQGKYYVAAVMLLCIICGGVLGFLTTRAIKKKKKEVAERLNLPARLQSDIRATKTFAIAIAVYCVSYVPTIVYAVVGDLEDNHANDWLGFLAWYAISISSAVNPIIYYIRNSRCRSAFKQFLNDPFGSSDFKEKPSGRAKGRMKRDHQGVDNAKKNDNEGTGGFQTNGSQARQKYHGERRNGMMILSIQDLQTHLSNSEARKDGKANQQPNHEAIRSIAAAILHPISVCSLTQLAIQGREACAPTMQAQKPCEGKEEQTDNLNQEDEEVSKKRRIENVSRKRQWPSSRMKIYPLGKSRQPEDLVSRQEKNTGSQEILGKRQNSETLGVKQAWLSEEDIENEGGGGG